MGRRADLKTGYDCNSNCLFCVIGDKLFTGDRSTEACVEEMKLSRSTCDDIVFTGAEVTIRPDFLTLVRTASKLGYANIQVQTNGRMMAYREFCERAVGAGANEFSPSIHGATGKVHDGLTRARGSFDQVVAAIEHLVDLGQRVITNTVVCKQNVSTLPELAQLLVDLRVTQFQLAFPHPTGHAATHFKAVVPKMSECAPAVHQALQIGIAGGVECMAEAIPYCHMAGFEQHVAELHIPPTEIIYDGYVVPDYATDRLTRGKIRFPQCADCRFEPICEGPWKEYPAVMGSDEFQPVVGLRVIDPAVVLDERFDMLGTTAPPWPGDENTKGWVALVFYPEDGSPACTTQLCGVQSRLADLVAQGVSVFGVSPDSEGSHRAFAAANQLDIPLVADVDHELARAYRASGRCTFLLDPQKRIAHFIPNVDLQDHGGQILAALRRLTGPPGPLGGADDLVTLRTA